MNLKVFLIVPNSAPNSYKNIRTVAVEMFYRDDKKMDWNFLCELRLYHHLIPPSFKKYLVININ